MGEPQKRQWKLPPETILQGGHQPPCNENRAYIIMKKRDGFKQKPSRKVQNQLCMSVAVWFGFVAFDLGRDCLFFDLAVVEGFVIPFGLGFASLW